MELVNRNITYRMYPNSEQEILLQDTRGLHCRVYNTFLEEHKRCYEQGLGSLTFGKMCRELTQWRATVPDLDCLNAQSLQVTAKRVDRAFDGFFRRVKTGDTPGYPRFKQPHRYPGWGYKTHGDGWRLFETPALEGSKQKPRSHSLRLSGIGTIRLRGRGRFAGIPKTCEIVRKRDKWYISVTFDVIPKDIAREPGTETAAFDWGVKNLLTIAKADGTIETIDNPKWLRKRLDALATLQRVVSKEERKVKVSIGLDPDQPISKGTRLPLTLKLKRLYKQVSALHGKIANQRHDLHHKLSAFLVSRFGCLASEVLDVESMVKKPAPKVDPETGGFAPNGARRKAGLNRNILDSAPATLLAMISTKAEEAATKSHTGRHKNSQANPEVPQVRDRGAERAGRAVAYLPGLLLPLRPRRERSQNNPALAARRLFLESITLGGDRPAMHIRHGRNSNYSASLGGVVHLSSHFLAKKA